MKEAWPIGNAPGKADPFPYLESVFIRDCPCDLQKVARADFAPALLFLTVLVRAENSSFPVILRNSCQFVKFV